MSEYALEPWPLADFLCIFLLLLASLLENGKRQDASAQTDKFEQAFGISQ